MPSRPLMIDGVSWQVSPSGFITQFNADEFALVFTRGSGDSAEVRVTRYSPRGATSRGASLAELTDAELRALFATSQPSITSPEAGLPRVTAPAASATVDLQAHSTASDGAFAPAAVAHAAAAAQLAAFAMTDHDSVSGLEAAAAAATTLGIRVVPGVELSALHNGREVHLLGLHLASLGVLETRLEEFRARRAERAVAIVGKLRALGVGVSFEDVQREAGRGAVGRPHIARAIIGTGACKDFHEVFDRFLGAGRPAFVAKPPLSVRDGVDLIRESGGLAIWAHPGREGRLELLEVLVAEGLDGAEVLHPGHSPEDVKRIAALCEHLRILPSGGSDWHGETSGNRALGAMHVPAEWLARQDQHVAARRSAGFS